MTSKFLLAAASAALLFGAASTAMAADPKPPKASNAVLKQLQAAQAANNKKDYPTALTALDAAKKVADRTPYDDYLIARFSTSVRTKSSSAGLSRPLTKTCAPAPASARVMAWPR